MTAKNDITGDDISSGANSNEYREGHERIFGKKTGLHVLDDAAFYATGAPVSWTPDQPYVSLGPDGATGYIVGQLDDLKTNKVVKISPQGQIVTETKDGLVEIIIHGNLEIEGNTVPIRKDQLKIPVEEMQKLLGPGARIVMGPTPNTMMIAQATKREQELDDALDREVRSRDEYHEMADKLADLIAQLTGVDIGEHSSANSPWDNAVVAAEACLARALVTTTAGAGDKVISEKVEGTTTVDGAGRTEALTYAVGPITFYKEVRHFVEQTFGVEAADDTKERAHRFLEESLELAQAAGCTEVEAYQLVDYTFGRSSGEVAKEVGDVMTTLHALAYIYKVNPLDAGIEVLKTNFTKIEKIRAKWLVKPKFGAAPADTDNKQFNFFALATSAWNARWAAPQHRDGSLGNSWDWWWSGVQWGRAQMIQTKER